MWTLYALIIIIINNSSLKDPFLHSQEYEYTHKTIAEDSIRISLFLYFVYDVKDYKAVTRILNTRKFRKLMQC